MSPHDGDALDGAEAQLWARALDHERRAFAAIFELHATRVYGHVIRLMQNRSDVEDVVAATFLELWRRRSDVRLVDDSVLPWVLVTATNIARNSRRATLRWARLLSRLPHEGSSDPMEAAHDRLAASEQRSRLTSALRELRRDDAALVVLTSTEQMTVAEVAAVLGITVGTARVRLHRARRRLQASLGSSLVSQDEVTLEGLS